MLPAYKTPAALYLTVSSMTDIFQKATRLSTVTASKGFIHYRQKEDNKMKVKIRVVAYD
jgi:hypothetical protein